MASKFMCFSLLFALAVNFSSVAAVDILGVPVLLHFSSAVTDNNVISLRVNAGGVFKGSSELRPNQEFEIHVDVNGVFVANARYGSRSVTFNAYDPGRDKGQANMFWKADGWGFSISYDKIFYTRVAPWA